MKPKDGILLLQREDKERAEEGLTDAIPASAVVRDWPTLERTAFSTWLLYKLSGVCDRLAGTGNSFLRRALARCADHLAMRTVRPCNLRAGMGLLTGYDVVYSTRLHGAILSMLLGKPTYILDNHYGKNSAFYGTWLQDAEGVQMLASVKSHDHG